MSSPKSTPWRDDALQGAVASRVVGLTVLPTAPEDADPGAGEDACGVGMRLALLAVPTVELLSPRAGADGVLGKVDQGLAQLLVACPAEGDDVVLARGTRRGHCASQCGQGLGAGKASPAVADLGQQRRCAHGASPRQALEDGSIGMQGQLFTDVGLELGDLCHQCAKHAYQAQRDHHQRVSSWSAHAWRRRPKTLQQLGGRAAAAIGIGLQPGSQASVREPRRLVLAGKRSRKRSAIAESISAKTPTAAGKTTWRWARS